LVASKPRSRRLIAGSTGWTAEDLDKPAIERQWEAGHFEIVEGVLTLMPPAYFDGGGALYSLVRVVDDHLRGAGNPGRFGFEVDLVLGSTRVVKPDAVLLLSDDLRKQKRIESARNGKRRRKLVYGRLRIPPSLVIESISFGHEHRDEVLKRQWYAEAGIPNYWLLDAFKKSLVCMVLEERNYLIDVEGRRGTIRPSTFPGLKIRLADLWVGD
jgi:Uma2 family endonuclease